eukprot:gene3663-3712_t
MVHIGCCCGVNGDVQFAIAGRLRLREVYLLLWLRVWPESGAGILPMTDHRRKAANAPTRPARTRGKATVGTDARFDAEAYLQSRQIALPHEGTRSIKECDLVDILCMIHAEITRSEPSEPPFAQWCQHFAVVLGEAKAQYRHDMRRYGEIMEIEHLNHSFHLRRMLRGGEGVLLREILGTTAEPAE